MKIYICRFNKYKECLFELVSNEKKNYNKKFIFSDSIVLMFYRKNRKFINPIKYDKIMNYNKLPSNAIYNLDKIKNYINITVNNDSTIIINKEKHIIDYTYEKRK